MNLKHHKSVNRDQAHYAVIGPLGAIQFHHWIGDDPMSRDLAGLETHYAAASKPDYLGEGSHHDICWLLEAPCWHDGTSLWAMEYWLPMFREVGEEWLWNRLERQYREIFESNHID